MIIETIKNLIEILAGSLLSIYLLFEVTAKAKKKINRIKRKRNRSKSYLNEEGTPIFSAIPEITLGANNILLNPETKKPIISNCCMSNIFWNDSWDYLYCNKCTEVVDNLGNRIKKKFEA